jgi:hypothetical protein
MDIFSEFVPFMMNGTAFPPGFYSNYSFIFHSEFKSRNIGRQVLIHAIHVNVISFMIE